MAFFGTRRTTLQNDPINRHKKHFATEKSRDRLQDKLADWAGRIVAPLVCGALVTAKGVFEELRAEEG